MKIDQSHTIPCGVDSGGINSDKFHGAIQGEKQCHEQEQERSDEALYDVNECRLDPPKVRAAHHAEMDYFRKMKVYDKVPIQKCKDPQESRQFGPGG